MFKDNIKIHHYNKFDILIFSHPLSKIYFKQEEYFFIINASKNKTIKALCLDIKLDYVSHKAYIRCLIKGIL